MSVQPRSPETGGTSPRLRWWRGMVLAVLAGAVLAAEAQADGNLFQEGVAAYRSGDYARAADAFGKEAVLRPASGTLLNLGNAEWQRGQTGRAILAWEQARWLDPFNNQARNNLAFARKTAQLESPRLTWFEVVSTWLPNSAWAWIAALSLWTAVGLVTLPGILRAPKAAWHQAVAACGLAVFLLSLPAHLGIHTRSKLGFILEKDTPLRLTPTQEAQYVTRLAAGEPARWVRQSRGYVLVRTSRAAGWVEHGQLGLTVPSDR